MKTILISSGNAHKINEIDTLLNAKRSKETSSQDPIKVMSIYEALSHVPDIVEDGLTFEENAIKKVLPFPNIENRWYLADDSGLVVDGLNGEPGIYSARYAGENATSDMLCQKILDNLGDNPNRSARFKCVIAVKHPDGKITTYEGTVEGRITHEIIGENGFGYDPIFIPEGFDRTFAQMTSDEKNELSHRYRALNQVTLT